MTAAAAEKPRRTQESRREATIRKLLDAGAEVLIELGYAEASVQRVCDRAGVSHGALFRHFPTREAFMVAVADDVGAKLLARYRREFEKLRTTEEPLALALRLVRDACRSRDNQAWYELGMAARTTPSLREALQPIATRYHQSIVALARELLPDVALAMGDRFPALVELVIAFFDGESVHRFVLDTSPTDEQRMELLVAVSRLLTAPRS
jgi:AcrR family transcriptional regulator